MATTSPSKKRAKGSSVVSSASSASAVVTAAPGRARDRGRGPVHRRLRHLIVNLIGKETWSALDADVKGDAYEGLLDRGVSEAATAQGSTSLPVR